MDPIHQDGDRLMIEAVAASDLAVRFGTPLYVTSEAALRANVRSWRTALHHAWPHGPTRVLVSLKANPTIALRRILDDEGAGCDVFGAYELEIALDAGTPAELISVNGSTKPEALIVRAITAGTRLTVDSVEELAAAAAAARRLGRTAHVRLRLRPDLTDVETASEFTERDPLGEVADAYKPGIPIAALREALERLDLEGIDLAGVHAHLGRHTSALEPFRLHAQRLAGLVGELARAMPGWKPREIDLGGGYSFPGDPTGRALRAASAHTPSPAEYAAAVAGGLAEGLSACGVDPAGIALEIEPGRAVYGSAGVHLSTVLNVKRQAAPVPRVWVGCDSSEVLLSDTGWEHSRWEPVCTDLVAGPDQEVDVVGVSCGFDTITPGARLPRGVAAGDVIAFLATGAYEETLAGNFNSMPRPASVLVSGDRAEVVRRAETLSDVTRRDLLPRRLRGEAPRVVGVDHVSLTVDDLDRSVAFYCRLLGLTLHDRGRLEPELIEQMTGVPDAEVDYADVNLGSRILELLHHRTAAVRRPIASRQERPGSVHIGLRVDDAAAVHGRLTAAGFAPLSAPRTLPDDGSGWSGSIVFYVRDPDGVMLEIVERAEAPSRASSDAVPVPSALETAASDQVG
jgi:diaminopimelate decarboxylase